MLSRTLRLAALAILTGTLSGPFLAPPALGQNLDAGKPPQQLFASTCNACHKSARGLLRTVAPGSLPGFLRQHYTTSQDMAKVLSGYLLANGATEQPRVANVPVNRQGRPDAQPGNPQAAAPGAAPAPPPDARQARRPDADGLNPAGPDAQRPPRNAKQAARTPEAGPDEQLPAAPKAAAKNTKRGASPTETAALPSTAAADPVAKPAPTGEAAIAAAVPLPEPAGLPPPGIGDFKIDPPKAEAAKADAPRADAPKQEAKVEPKQEQPKADSVTGTAAAPSSSPPPAPSRTSSASLTPKPAAGPPPAPPISH